MDASLLIIIGMAFGFTLGVRLARDEHYILAISVFIATILYICYIAAISPLEVS